jgi:acylphosphatase
MMECERYRVSGRVQGVGFRYAALQEARRLGVAGWVRNLPDGQVEVLAQAEAVVLERFHDWLRQGPPAARVLEVKRFPESSLPPGADFDIR